jgi:predicted DNA-binding transcriptional regulator AlpA
VQESRNLHTMLFREWSVADFPKPQRLGWYGNFRFPALEIIDQKNQQIKYTKVFEQLMSV